MVVEEYVDVVVEDYGLVWCIKCLIVFDVDFILV